MKVYTVSSLTQVTTGSTIETDGVLVETAPHEDYLVYQINSFSNTTGTGAAVSTVKIQGRMDPTAAWVDIASHTSVNNVLAQTAGFMPYIRFQIANTTGATRYVSTWVGR